MKFNSDIETVFGTGILKEKACLCDIPCTRSTECPSTTYLVVYNRKNYKGDKLVEGNMVFEEVDLGKEK